MGLRGSDLGHQECRSLLASRRDGRYARLWVRQSGGFLGVDE